MTKLSSRRAAPAATLNAIGVVFVFSLCSLCRKRDGLGSARRSSWLKGRRNPFPLVVSASSHRTGHPQPGALVLGTENCRTKARRGDDKNESPFVAGIPPQKTCRSPRHLSALAVWEPVGKFPSLSNGALRAKCARGHKFAAGAIGGDCAVASSSSFDYLFLSGSVL